MSDEQKKLFRGLLPDGRTTTVFCSPNEPTDKDNTWIIFHDEQGPDRLSFISASGLNAFLFRTDSGLLFLTLSFSQQRHNFTFDPIRPPIVQIDCATLVDDGNWVLSDDFAFYSVDIDEDRFVEDLLESIEMKVRVFTVEEKDEFLDICEYGVGDFSFPLNEFKVLFKQFFPSGEFVDISTGEVV